MMADAIRPRKRTAQIPVGSLTEVVAAIGALFSIVSLMLVLRSEPCSDIPSTKKRKKSQF